MIEYNTAYILCGGKSRRMGSDKLFLRVGHSTLLERTVDTCRREFQSVKLSASDSERLKLFGLEIVPDYAGSQGPLAGIIACLQDCSERHCFVTAADFVSLDSNIIGLLRDRLHRQEYLGLSESGRPQPLCGFYAISALPKLLKAAERGVTRVTDLLDELDCELLPVEKKFWLNVNSPSDLEAARGKYD
jgi:molybdopterin-guanine dinucleotide biosynthesis protein A